MRGPAFRAKQEEKRKRPAARLSSSDSDDEWTPDMERRKRAKGIITICLLFSGFLVQ